MRLRARRPRARQPSDNAKRQRIEHDREQCAGDDVVLPLRRQQLHAHAHHGEDEGELADLRERRGDRERGAQGPTEQAHDQQRRHGLADHDDREHLEHLERMAQEHARLEQHAHRDEE